MGEIPNDPHPHPPPPRLTRNGIWSIVNIKCITPYLVLSRSLEFRTAMSAGQAWCQRPVPVDMARQTSASTVWVAHT